MQYVYPGYGYSGDDGSGSSYGYTQADEDKDKNKAGDSDGGSDDNTGNMLIWMILGVLVLGGAGVAIYILLIKDKGGNEDGEGGNAVPPSPPPAPGSEPPSSETPAPSPGPGPSPPPSDSPGSGPGPGPAPPPGSDGDGTSANNDGGSEPAKKEDSATGVVVFLIVLFTLFLLLVFYRFYRGMRAAFHAPMKSDWQKFKNQMHEYAEELHKGNHMDDPRPLPEWEVLEKMKKFAREEMDKYRSEGLARDERFNELNKIYRTIKFGLRYHEKVGDRAGKFFARDPRERTAAVSPG